MTIFAITYISSENNEILGREFSSRVKTTKLPHDPADKNIYIRKVFSNHGSESWKVIDIRIFRDSQIKINCDVIIQPVIYATQSISERHSTNGSKLIRGRIVECDFGYFDQELDYSLSKSKTVKDYNSRLPFEMVKRRMVVIMSNRQDPALVVPISTTQKAKNPEAVVALEGLPTDLVAYPNTDCYAKTGSVTLVSGHRLFPLRYYVGERKVYDSRVEKKLHNDDVVRIKKSIFIGVGGNNILNEIDQAHNDLKSKNEEIQQLIAKYDELKSRYDEIWQDLQLVTDPE